MVKTLTRVPPREPTRSWQMSIGTERHRRGCRARMTGTKTRLKVHLLGHMPQPDNRDNTKFILLTQALGFQA